MLHVMNVVKMLKITKKKIIYFKACFFNVFVYYFCNFIQDH